MKNKKTILSLFALLAMTSLVGCTNNKNPNEENNECTENCDVEREFDKRLDSQPVKDNYYKDITTDVSSDAFKQSLNTLLVNTHTTKGNYDKAKTVLAASDSYGDNTYITCLYTGQKILTTNSGSSAGCWNREHIWAKAHGFGDTSYTAYSDCHHLRATETSINGAHGDKYYDELTTYTGSDEYGNKWNDEVFEPRDEVKGDVARMLFYMVCRYSDSELTLTLSNDASEASKSGTAYYGNGTLGMLSTLCKWAIEDPVDSTEIYRNNVVYGYQGNANPFIDHPEYAYYLYTDEFTTLGVTSDNLSEKFNKVYCNTTAVKSVIDEINALGTITLDSKDALLNVNESYNALSEMDKCFVTNYGTLYQSIKTYEALYSAANQNVNTDTSFDVTNVSAKTGTFTENGVSINYSCATFNNGKGIYAQTTGNVVINASGLYSTIKSIAVTFTSNQASASRDATVTVSDGTNSTTTTQTVANKTTTATATLDISSLDLSSGNLTITVSASGNSIIVKAIDFKI